MKISDYRRDFADYSSAIELAHYEHRAGLKPELHTEPIYERYGDLFTREEVAALKRAESETPAHLETERAGLRALYSAACIGYLEAQSRELTDERARCEAATRVDWNGESIPVNSVQKILTNEPDAARRRELAARWSGALASCDDLRAARFESFHDAVRSLGFDSYRALLSEVTGTDLKKLVQQTDAFLDQTERAYTGALAQATARDLPGVSFADLHYADYFFFQRHTRLDQFFPAQDLLPTYQAAMRGLGIRVEQQQNIHIDDEPRPSKNPRAACFRIQPPDDVRLLLAPVGGVYDYTTLFHEVGHAQHFGWSSRELFKRYPEFMYAPDHATTEGYAFLLSHLLLDDLWLSEHRNISSQSRAQEITREIALVTFHQIRRLCGKLSYEITLHDSPQLQSEQLAQTYADTLTQATGFRRTPALYLMDVDDGFYSAAYLRALAFEVSLREHLRTRWGRRWWANAKAGDELIDLWNTASRYSTEELARLIGFGEISFELLAETLIAAIKRD
jgi:oligoendopeptidase F